MPNWHQTQHTQSPANTERLFLARSRFPKCDRRSGAGCTPPLVFCCVRDHRSRSRRIGMLAERPVAGELFRSLISTTIGFPLRLPARYAQLDRNTTGARCANNSVATISMKVIILAGGFGTRLSEETSARPKPMIEIGGKPLLWHLMNLYASHGFKDFIVACGYKGELIKEYFHNFVVHNTDYMIDLRDGSRQTVNGSKIDWRIGLIDTGIDTMTGGRILRLKKLIGSEPFMVTYGDG